MRFSNEQKQELVALYHNGESLNCCMKRRKPMPYNLDNDVQKPLILVFRLLI